MHMHRPEQQRHGCAICSEGETTNNIPGGILFEHPEVRRAMGGILFEGFTHKWTHLHVKERRSRGTGESCATNTTFPQYHVVVLVWILKHTVCSQLDHAFLLPASAGACISCPGLLVARRSVEAPTTATTTTPRSPIDFPTASVPGRCPPLDARRCCPVRPTPSSSSHRYAPMPWFEMEQKWWN